MAEKDFILIDIRNDSEVFNKHIDTVGSKILLHPNTTSKVSLSHPEGVYDNLRLGGTTQIANQNYTVYNIPMNMIQFNVVTIVNHLNWVKKIFLVCDTGRRSQYIKNKYFSAVPNIVVDTNLQMTHLQSGMNTITLTDSSASFVIPVITQQGIYSIMRIIQIIYGVIFISCLGYMAYALKKNKCVISRVPLYIGLLIASMALFNGLTNTCTMSLILKDYLN